MAEITQAIVTFCAEEVERQGRGPVQVAWMVEAWMYAAARTFRGAEDPTRRLLQMLGHLVERENNKETWRQFNVRVGRHVCPNVAEVPDLMVRWIRNLRAMTPEEAYKELMEIHPFVDGNGRVGKIVYNALKGTLDKPQMPPNFFNCANP